MKDIAPKKGFDTARPGTAEEIWSSLLERQPRWLPRSGPLLVVAPHPDDETLACGGLIHHSICAGRAVTVLSVTDGEAAHAHWRGLAAVRRRELQRALRELGGGAVTVRRLGVPDGRVARFRGRLRRAVAALLQPRATLLAPYEHDGHCDHDAAGAVCAQVAKSSGVDFARYCVWTWQHAVPRELGDVRWGRFELDPPARLAKQRALRCFESQRGLGGRAAIVPEHVLRYFARPYEAYLL